jgi:uncharacterized cofD-like protein
MFKVVIFGGGSGLSQLVSGMIKFDWDITAVVSVSDNGKSTGALRKEFDIPAVGDITKVMIAMSGEDEAVKDLFMYRFDKGNLKGHSVKNIIMTALLEKEGDFAHSLPILSSLLDVKGTICPVTEDNADLVGTLTDGTEIIGEAEITNARGKVKSLRYNKKVKANPRVIKAVKEADLIILSSGSLVTSIMPHIIIPEIQEAIRNSRADKLYVCNILTQPGETDSFTVTDHIDAIEAYIGKNTIDCVIANDAALPSDMKSYADSEDKDPVELDREEIKRRGIDLISEKLYSTKDKRIRHDALKTAYLMFSYLMDKKDEADRYEK